MLPTDANLNVAQEGNELMRYPMLALGILTVSGCQSESEDDCYKRLLDDFDSYAETARNLGDNNGALAARESALTATLIWSDDDRSICDYVSAGPFLELK